MTATGSRGGRMTACTKDSKNAVSGMYLLWIISSAAGIGMPKSGKLGDTMAVECSTFLMDTALPESGVQNFSDGYGFVGEFRLASKWISQYFDDQIHGFGVYHFANGQSYERSWHKGKRHGFGSYTLKDGGALSGEWDSGSLKNYLPLADSNADRAVQRARKAWMEWLRAPRIEEQANKAVEEAYRAASNAQKASIKAVQSRLHNERSARRQKYSLPAFIWF
ncbi:hypothetical protein KSP40_PGU001747 [Platanthera guangdongensis]|uniref:Uncharacterized protein n=1 Tax=Platanthera guangdongensis TaxID=2320717 RepID=A0ABR2LUP1_9ASPA